MKSEFHDQPRVFEVGLKHKIKMLDCGQLQLASDEQITFITEGGSEYDVARKSWGFYATPSLNNRLPKYGFRPVLVKSPQASFFIFLVEKNKEADFEIYLKSENHQIICWLDSDENLKILVETFCE
ncbi:MAG: hypothetical protein EXS63_07645 [Candidatus Omnitrophica bacterium]|nr:hypothetical protein [Candidatus Omnitrophota bacterium]